jgi:hypothetical protein
MNDRFRLLLHATIGAALVTYSVAEESLVLGFTAMLVWAAAWPVSLGRNGKPLPRLVIGMLVLGATALMLLRLVQAPQDLVSIVSQYLLWMQLIKLYDRVGLRDEAQLLAMSVALVIGACLTSSRLLLGVCLLVYAPMAFWTAAALQVHAGRLRDLERRRAAGATEARALPGPGSIASAMRSLRRVVAGSIVVIGVLTAFGFVFLPRSGDSAATTDLLLGATDMTGFDDEVTLGEEGLLSESEVAVLDVDISRTNNGAPAGVALSRLYLRGAALDVYEEGRWRSARRGSQSTSLLQSAGDTYRPPGVGEHPTTYRLEVQTLLRDRPQVFSLMNPVAVSFDRPAQLQVDPTDYIMVAEADGLPAYTVEARPDAPISNLRAQRRLPTLFDEGPIHDEAMRLLEESGFERDPAAHFTENDDLIARAFESHLRRRCEYTTELVAPAPGEDPIEMFLFRTQRGHCEYFASSMAAMLRAIGIDARVMTGYVVDAERLAAETFIVRENDAHAWVEAQVAPGVWKTFDPSPPAQVDALRTRTEGIAAMYRSLKEGLQDFWARKVVGFNRSAQNDLLGDWRLPIEERLRKSLERAGRGAQASPIRAAISAALSGVIVFAATAASFFVGRAGLRQCIAWLRRRRDILRIAGADDEARRRLEQAGFYHSALTRLRRAGLGRPVWMTPLAHAGRLADVDAPLADAVRGLAETYYAARYGQRWLTPEDQAEADARLARIDERLREVRPGRLRRGGDLA